MSSARITGLLASLVFAALLVWVVLLTFNQDGTVLPSVRVEPRAGVAAKPPAAESLLAERSRLQAERAVASGAATEKLAVNPGRLEMEAGVDKPRALVAGWIANKPADADAFLRPPQHRGDLLFPTRMPTCSCSRRGAIGVRTITGRCATAAAGSSSASAWRLRCSSGAGRIGVRENGAVGTWSA